MNWLAIFLGGGIGSTLRYLTGILSAKAINTSFPIATLSANLLACLIYGIAFVWFQDKSNLNEFWKYFLLIGLCGGFSTFSTFSFETLQLLKNNMTGIAIANITLSILSCIGLLYFLTKNIKI